MGKISKLFKGELKKIFLGPGIFFMSAFLILALTIAPKLFSPSQKEDLSSSVSLSTTNVSSTYSSFLEFKADYGTTLDALKNDVEQLIFHSSNFKQNITDLSNQIYNLRMELNSLIFNGEIEERLDCLNQLIDKSNQLNQLYNSYTQDYALPLLLVDDNLDYDIRFELTQLIKLLTKDGDTSSAEYYVVLNDTLENYNCALNIKKLTDKIANLKYSNENLQELLDNFYYKDSLVNRKNDLLSQITGLANEAVLDEEFNVSQLNISNIEKLSLEYLSMDYNSHKVVENGLYLEVSKHSADAEMSVFIGFSDFNNYRFQENFSKYEYLLINGSSDADYDQMFSFNHNSQGSDASAFDYMYFTMEIASFLIIAFTVIIGAGMISKEFSEGTIKLLAIRPFSRNKIIFAKILATIFISFLFVLISLLVSLITGYIIYGISFSSMLVVFNSTLVFALPNWVVFLIYVASLMIKIWVFALLAIAISTLFKSYVAAVCISSFIYIFNLILTFVSKGANWLKYNIFANLDLFKYFGGSFNNVYVENQNLTNLFISPVFADTSIWFTATIIGGLLLVLNTILFTVFKHRDIT